MADQLATTPDELKAAIGEYRLRMAEDYRLYEIYKGKFLPWYPEAWAQISHLLIVQARFWQGETLRAKHNLARYMRGEPLEEQRKFVSMQFEDDGKWVIGEIENVENALAIALEARVPKALEKLDNEYYQMCVAGLRQTADYIERYTYGG